MPGKDANLDRRNIQYTQTRPEKYFPMQYFN